MSTNNQEGEAIMVATTERVESDASILDTQRMRCRRRAWHAVATLVAAAVAQSAVGCSEGGDESNTVAKSHPTDSPAVAVATGYLDAYTSFDRARAASYLVDDARMSGWKRWNRWLEATQFRPLLGSCEESTTSAGRTRVVCPYDFHCLGSDELRRGPFPDNAYSVTIRDGEIVNMQDDVPFLTNGFSEQMWEPFADWVGKRYPQDAPVMYEDWPDADGQSLTDRSLKLWAQHTQDYIDAGG
jgi:hypothetical protein